MGGVRKELGKPKRLGSFKKGEGGERVVLKDFPGGKWVDSLPFTGI